MVIYGFVAWCIRTGILLASFAGNRKANAWVKGRKGWEKNLKFILESKRKEKPTLKIFWMHCSSLGEFEQGRPLFEERKKTAGDDWFFLLTFFSPSGFEARKHYAEADLVLYLPPDSYSNAELFLELVKPEEAWFVKYDFWPFYLDGLVRKKVPHFLISAHFRPDQWFFKPWGKFMLKRLKKFSWIFVQTHASLKLAEVHGIKNISWAGDTRIDRVVAIRDAAVQNPIVEKFCGSGRVLICGSTWGLDESVIYPFFKLDKNIRWVIAPHETGQGTVERICNRFGKDAIRYSELLKREGDISQNARVLILDQIGILSQIYRYGRVAYVGGGFGTSVHNTLEPAAFGLPVVTGPAIEKFNEAVTLKDAGGLFVVKTEAEATHIFNRLFSDPVFHASASQQCREFIETNRGAVQRVLEKTQ